MPWNDGRVIESHVNLSDNTVTSDLECP